MIEQITCTNSQWNNFMMNFGIPFFMILFTIILAKKTNTSLKDIFAIYKETKKIEITIETLSN